jgi:phosphoribosylformimino-5-aminoimidazole carboxamide ribotide isomerase
MVDAGVADLASARALFQRKVEQVIVGTETLSNLNFLLKTVKCFGSGKIVVSLDLMNGRVLSKSGSARSMEPVALASKLKQKGITQLIVLDLARVGSGEGVDFSLLKEILNLSLHVFVGGGVRDISDLLKLEEIGVNGVLLATALHNGSIQPDELRSHNFL